MVGAYGQLHALGFAHSFEAWEGEALVGGLYGVSLGAAFFGESMFADRPDASKVAFVESVEWLRGARRAAHRLPGPHRAPAPASGRGRSRGRIPRRDFEMRMATAGTRGPWRFDALAACGGHALPRAVADDARSRRIAFVPPGRLPPGAGTPLSASLVLGATSSGE